MPSVQPSRFSRLKTSKPLKERQRIRIDPDLPEPTKTRLQILKKDLLFRRRLDIIREEIGTEIKELEGKGKHAEALRMRAAFSPLLRDALSPKGLLDLLGKLMFARDARTFNLVRAFGLHPNPEIRARTVDALFVFKNGKPALVKKFITHFLSDPDETVIERARLLLSLLD